MKVIYIAGPYRADTVWGVTCNIHRARELGAEVAKLGHMPLVPHANTAYYDFVMPDQFWLDGDIAIMLRCDAVLTTPDWERSAGARQEVEVAKQKAIPVFHTLGDLISYYAKTA